MSDEVATYVGAGSRVLRYRVVRAPDERHPLLYLHGIESHGAWFLPAARGLAERGCTTYLLDRRGSGLNRDGQVGDAESADELLEDVRSFRSAAGLSSLTLVGLSWGGKLAVAAALDDPEGVCALVLVTPGLVPRVDLPWTQKLRVLLSLANGGGAHFDLPIEPEMFTRTPRYLDYIENDPDRIERVTARFLKASRSIDRKIRRGLPELPVPVLLLLAEHDQIIDNDRTRDLLRRLPEGRLRVELYDDATHAIQFDHTARLVDDVSSFLDEVAC
jgi:pimeloyl-ACP methyl ester carboxylesterase